MVVRGRRGRVAQVLRAAAERDQDPQAQQLVRRPRALNMTEERLEHLASAPWIAGDPRGDGELIVSGACERIVGELARKALGDGERRDRIGAAVQQVERRSRVQAEPTQLAHREVLRVQELFGSSERLARTGKGEQAGDRTELELSIATRSLRIGVVEEIRRRLSELSRHVLERAHRGTDLAKLDRADVRAREVRSAELRLRQPRGGARLAHALAQLLEGWGERSRTPSTAARGRGHAATLPWSRGRVNWQSTVIRGGSAVGDRCPRSASCR